MTEAAFSRKVCMCGHTKEQHDGKGPWGGCSGCTVTSGMVCIGVFVPFAETAYGAAVEKMIDEELAKYLPGELLRRIRGDQ